MWTLFRRAFVVGLLLSLSAMTGEAGDWETGPGYRRLKVEPFGSGKDGFTLLSPETTGITFTNLLPESRGLASQILPSGSGVAAGDVDGDGLCDVYFCGLRNGNHLYRNLGHWKFEDITERAGVGCTNLDTTGAALVDIDGDGDLDLIVNSVGGGTHVFFNDGHGKFTEAKYVLNEGLGGMSLGLADYDGDGWLDLYIANYRVNSISDQPDIRFSLRTVDGHLTLASINGKPLTDPEWTNRFRFDIRDDAKGGVKFAKEELGEPDALFRNLRGGRFERVKFTGGAFLDEEGKPLKEAPLDWGLGVMFRDLNNDGKPDLYVCNDFTTPDRIWMNVGGGRFQAIKRLAIRQTPLSSMAMDVADINRDGLDDLFVVDMLSREHRRRLVQRTNLRPELLSPGLIDNRPQYSRNTLQLNRGDGTYAEIAQHAGLEASEWSWSPIFLDVDLDGYEDLLVANGFLRDNMNLDALEAVRKAGAAQAQSMSLLLQQRRLFPPLATPKMAFRNEGGLKFTEVGQQWGFNTAVISQGMCLADLDNDGDMDVIANNLDSVASVYRNDSSKPRIAISLKGLSPNTHGIGAKILVLGGPLPVQSQQIISGGRYLSCDQAMRTFAAGSPTNVLSIEVNWPRGRRSVITNATANYIYEIDEASSAEPEAPSSLLDPSIQALPWFGDVSSRLSHKHHEDSFDDFSRQPTLPKRLSQLGPGLCWCDLTGAGRDDLVIAAGKGGKTAVFLNDGHGEFQLSESAPLQPTAARDQTTVLEWPGKDGKSSLLIGFANYEDTHPTNSTVLAGGLASGSFTALGPELSDSIGPMALGDLDGNGNLDLFVGGRVSPGNYPAPVSSRIYRFQDGTFQLDQANSPLLQNIGMVSGAVWSDLDGDGFPELILACEWGPVRIFHNDHGHLSAWNPSVEVTASTPDATSGATREPLNSLNPRASALNQLSGWWNAVTTADLDGDGKLDIVASNWGSNSKYQSHRAEPLRLYYGDFNDERINGLLEAYFEPAMGKYVPERRLDIVARSLPFVRGQFASYQAYADTGIDEILAQRKPVTRFLEANWLESTVFFNRGDHFEPRLMPVEAQLAPAFAVVVADFDGDGHEDVFLSQNFFAVEPETSRYDAGRGLLLRGDGRGGLQALVGPESGITIYGEQRGAAAADFDGDGRVDLVVAQNAAGTRLFKNLRAKPGLRVRLKGPPGNPRGVGVQMRVKHAERLGPVREVHGGSGYWSQDSAVQVMSDVDASAQLWLRWPGGKTFTVEIPSGSAEVEVGIDTTVRKVR